MSIFGFSPSDVITSYSEPAEKSVRGVDSANGQAGPKLLSDSGKGVDLADQFLVFQLSSRVDGPTILEASQIEPKIDGSPEEPDVLAALELLSFHVGSEEDIEGDTCATMRVNFGKDESSLDSRFDTVFWSIAAGLKLYDQAKSGRSESKDLKGNFHRAFGNRPIEIPGGLGRLSFEVVEHKEPKWWNTLLGFGQSSTAKQLVSLLGFPAITTAAIAVVDELLDRLTNSSPKILFRSLPMRLALSKHARDGFTGGNPRLKIGAMSSGLCVLARGRDFNAIADANAFFYPTYGRLVPAEISEADLVAGKFVDPFKALTYAVFRVGMKGTKIDPTFNFSA
ncbi:MAG: hypothetical protein AMS22_05765 [Thiotrichales bacterium SG8_50]|nr:MAG: hypothetical protein AMS22_05765 [Thiotrichales bacterium SG8_50]